MAGTQIVCAKSVLQSPKVNWLALLKLRDKHLALPWIDSSRVNVSRNSKEPPK